MTSEIERFYINETKMPELQKCSGCKCKMLLSFFDFIENTGQLKKTCRKCLERNKINHDLVKYGNSVIYKIFCRDESITDCYVGSTTDFGRRKTNHKNACNNAKSTRYNLPVYRFIRDNGNWDNWDFEILENYPCRNKEQLVVRERYWFEKLNTTLNSQYPQRSQKESNKAYKEKNREKIKESNKAYREKNREKIKEYYEVNKKEILEKLKEKVQCPCGSVVRKSDLRRHERSQKHQNYLKSLS
jgi:hypothetical protein